MVLRIGVFTAALLALTLAHSREAKPAAPEVPATLAQAKLQAARKTFEAYWQDKEWPYVEVPYQWSVRWLNAQRQVSDRSTEQVTACQAHLERMRELQRITAERYQSRLVGVAQVNATEFYVAEAELWLAEARK